MSELKESIVRSKTILMLSGNPGNLIYGKGFIIDS